MKKIAFFLFSLSIQLLYSGNLINSTNSKKSSLRPSIFFLITRIGKKLIDGIVDVMAIPSVFPPENKKNNFTKQIKKKR